jgi:hypothetical protein
MTSKIQIGLAAGILSAVSFAQGPPPNVIYRERATMAGPAGQTFEYISSELSFDGAVVKNAPYSAEAVTETTQKLADGNRIARKTNATLYRDSEGRTRREQTLSAVGPWTNSDQPSPTVFINDPVSNTNLVLETKNKIARKMPSPKFMPPPPPLPPGAVLAGGVTVSGSMVPADVAKRIDEVKASGGTMLMTSGVMATSSEKDANKESLGTQMIEGVQAEGTRTTMTIPTGAIGNDLPIQIVSERWYSPDLHTVVMSKHSDPRMGETVYRLTNIGRGEPARSLFEVPADYTVTDAKPFAMKIKE